MERYDTIVVGLGGMGSAAAFHVAQRGRRVVGLEQFTLAHDRGSSHGRSRVTRQAYFENPAYVPLLGRANELWTQLQRYSGMRLIEITGGLMLGPPDGGVVKGTLASARTHGLPHEVLEAPEIRRRFPAFSIEDTKIGVLDKVAGVLFSEDCIRAHAAAATRAGAELRWQEPVVSWKATGDSVEVKTTQWTYVAGNLVLCAGPWMGELLACLSVPLAVERNVLYWFRPTTDLVMFAPDKFPVFIIEYEPGKVFYGFPPSATTASRWRATTLAFRARRPTSSARSTRTRSARPAGSSSAISRRSTATCCQRRRACTRTRRMDTSSSIGIPAIRT
jgi:sarcosine oxidase